MLLVLILVSQFAFAANTGVIDDDDDTPAPVSKPAARTSPEPVAKPAVKPVSKPTASKDDEDDEDDDDDDEPVVRKKVSRPGLLSAARAAGRGRQTVEDDEDEDDEDEGTYRNCRNCSRQRQKTQHIHTGVRITAREDIVDSPIWNSFKRNFAACAPGCQPTGMGVWRSKIDRPKPSCHHNGQAIDVAGMICSGVQYRSIRESRYGVGPFSDMVRCMRGRMKTLWRVADHYDHAHFSNGCIASGYRMY